MSNEHAVLASCYPQWVNQGAAIDELVTTYGPVIVGACINDFLDVDKMPTPNTLRSACAAKANPNKHIDNHVCERGWVETHDGFRPCSTCNVDGYESWRKGRWQTQGAGFGASITDEHRYNCAPLIAEARERLAR